MSTGTRPPTLRALGSGLAIFAFCCGGCVQPPGPGTGGTDVEPTAFGRGIVTVNNNDTYGSTNVSLVGLDGARLSQSFLSSADLLSGDVVVPSSPSTGSDVVLLDRDNAIVTWVDVRTARIRTQLHADDDEMARNPWDYLPISDSKAYITRYDPWPGNSEHGDVIVVNPTTATVTSKVAKRIDVAAALGLDTNYRAHPARGVVSGDRAYLTTVIATPFYEEYGSSRIVALDTSTDEVVAVHELDGLHDCTTIAISPSKEQLAITCSGDLLADHAHLQQSSALVLLSRSDLGEKKRITADKLAPGPLGFSVSFVSEQSLVVTAFGDGVSDTDDRALWLDLVTDEVREIHRARAVEIGAVLCPARIDGKTDAPLAPPACFVSDAGTGVLLRFPAQDGALGDPQAITVDTVKGLPPRYLGQF